MTPSSPSPPSITRRSFVDQSIVFVLFGIWLASVGRIVLEATQHRPFGVEATLAVAMAFVLPFVLRNAVRSHRPPR